MITRNCQNQQFKIINPDNISISKSKLSDILIVLTKYEVVDKFYYNNIDKLYFMKLKTIHLKNP